jgi:hypothetical protein
MSRLTSGSQRSKLEVEVLLEWSTYVGCVGSHPQATNGLPLFVL